MFTLMLVALQLPRTLEDGLSSGQLRKLRQLAFLEFTGIMDENGLPVRKRSRLQSVRNFAHSARERQVFGVPLKKLTERDQTRTPIILEMVFTRFLLSKRNLFLIILKF